MVGRTAGPSVKPRVDAAGLEATPQGRPSAEALTLRCWREHRRPDPVREDRSRLPSALRSWSDQDQDQDQAVAELRDLAGSRPHLLAEHVGVCLGWAEVTASAEAPGLRAQADLCKAAGAPDDLIAHWIETGRQRRRSTRATPYNGGG